MLPLFLILNAAKSIILIFLPISIILRLNPIQFYKLKPRRAYVDSKGEFFRILLFHLLPLRFHCNGGCWDRTQDCCDFGIDSQTS
jgi:hypothetical protein